MIRIGVDIGGAFTDVLGIKDGRIFKRGIPHDIVHAPSVLGHWWSSLGWHRVSEPITIARFQ